MSNVFQTTSRAALIALLAVSPAALTAQEAEGEAEEQMEGEAPAAEVEAEGEMAAPAEGEMAEEEMPEPVEGQITLQSENTFLANDFLGAEVMNANDESVGEISDFIINLDGSVEGVVIGVGGFLGLGKKPVAIEMSAIEVMEQEGGGVVIMTSATRTDLEAAPEFVTAEEQADAEAAAQAQQEAEAAAEQPMTEEPATDGTASDN